MSELTRYRIVAHDRCPICDADIDLSAWTALVDKDGEYVSYAAIADTHPVAPGAGDAKALRQDWMERIAPHVGPLMDAWDRETADVSGHFRECMNRLYAEADQSDPDAETIPAAQPAAPAAVVDDAMVERACHAYSRMFASADEVTKRDVRNRMRVALAARLPGGGEAVGWKLVPVEPTRAMAEAGQTEASMWPAVGGGISALGAIAAYDAMLAASTPPAVAG